MKNEIITLITKSCTGATVELKETEVFAEKKSVRQSEFYAAQQVGLNPSLVFVIDIRDFESVKAPVEVIYNEETYTVIRTYCIGENVEITVGG